MALHQRFSGGGAGDSRTRELNFLLNAPFICLLLIIICEIGITDHYEGAIITINPWSAAS